VTGGSTFSMTDPANSKARKEGEGRIKEKGRGKRKGGFKRKKERGGQRGDGGGMVAWGRYGGRFRG